MDQETQSIATAILKKSPKDWTKDDNALIVRLVKEGYRQELKRLRGA